MRKRVTNWLSLSMISLSFMFAVGCFHPAKTLALTLNKETGSTVPETNAVGTDVARDRKEDGAPLSDDGEDSLDSEAKESNQQPLDAAMDLIQTAREYWVDGDEEKSLEALDQAYGLIAEVKTDDDSKLMRQKEDLRFTIAKRILEIYASRFITAKGTHRAIPVTINKYVEREIASFKNQERHFFTEAYKRSGKFREEIVKALKAAGLPEELSWLPLIESGFNVKALSRSRALGLWQFIPSTGYKFGLRRTNWIDERMDPAKSTAAAIAYLKELHEMFGDWATVLAAYNCGEGTVLRAISRQKKDYLDNFWDLYERLPDETARYYPRFLAVLAILKDPTRYDIILQESAPVESEVVTVQKQIHLKTIAEMLGVSFKDLTALNPELRRHVTPPSPYSLRVPKGMGEVALAGLEKLQTWSGPKKGFLLHRVRKGENVAVLALRYHTTISAIVESNNLRRGVIRIGQRLKIPVDRTSSNIYADKET